MAALVAMGSASLRGRATECALLDDAIGAIRAGESRTLVLHGEAGIGRTALRDRVRRRRLRARADDASCASGRRAPGSSCSGQLCGWPRDGVATPPVGRLKENPGVPPAPLIDERKYAQLLGEVVRRIAVHNPEWTDFNQSDPGLTLVELFAFLAETLLWQIDERQRQRRRQRRRRVVLVVVGTAGLGALWRTLKKRAEQQADPAS